MPRPASASRRLVRVAVGATVGLGLLVVAGCGAGLPRSMDPAGVDGLEIPTPSPEPADFVAAVDNPYLPLSPGGRWTYQADGSGTTVMVTVTNRTLRIDGVDTTKVKTASHGRGRTTTTTRYYAQDRDGNVWSFGADDWRAGVAGARAGLVMPATPRVGDGFVQHDGPGAAEDRSEVLDVDAEVSTAYGAWTGVVTVRETTAQAPRRETIRSYAPGVGLVRTESDRGVTELVSYTPGR